MVDSDNDFDIDTMQGQKDVGNIECMLSAGSSH